MCVYFLDRGILYIEVFFINRELVEYIGPVAGPLLAIDT